MLEGYTSKLAVMAKSKRILWDMTQKDVAEAIKVERTRYHNFEKGNKLMNPNALFRLAKFLKISLDEIVGIQND